MKRILASISTRNRYDTTLPLAIAAVMNQTVKVDKLVIFDDNDQPIDIRENPTYAQLLRTLQLKNIPWEVIFGAKKGQHFNHQIANTMGYEWVWRIDDDTIPEPNVLENLTKYIDDDVGAVGGSVLVPDWDTREAFDSTGDITDVFHERNIQWGVISSVKSVDHLHCSFLYRAGIVDYNLALSKVAHREETLFTILLRQKGYKILVVPNTITWHLRNPSGGIREKTMQDNAALYQRDEQIFVEYLKALNNTIVVLNGGMGDHIVFKRVLPDVYNPMVFSCYPDIIPGRSIAEAIRLFGDIEQYNIYAKMARWQWTDSLENAYRKLYVRK